jgi:hypothetical protein
MAFKFDETYKMELATDMVPAKQDISVTLPAEPDQPLVARWHRAADGRLTCSWRSLQWKVGQRLYRLKTGI